MTGWSSSMPQNSGMRHLRHRVSPDHRAVDAEPHVAAVGLRHRAAEAGAEAAGHRRLHRQLAGDVVVGAEGADRRQHRRRAAGVDDGGGGVVAGEHRRQQIGDVALVAGVAVLAGEADVRAEAAAGAEELVQPSGVSLVAEAEKDTEGNASLDQVAAPDRHRGDADAAADKDRPGGFGVDLPRSREGVAERAGAPDPLARLQLAESIGASSEALDEEVEPDAVFGRDGLGDRDRPRQVGPAAALPPLPLAGEHVELARSRVWPFAVAQGEDPVAAGRHVRRDLAGAAAERRAHPACAALTEPAWISCSERTSASASLPAAIARVAAVAPVIVVTQGIPWRTAAVRIS